MIYANLFPRIWFPPEEASKINLLYEVYEKDKEKVFCYPENDNTDEWLYGNGF